MPIPRPFLAGTQCSRPCFNVNTVPAAAVLCQICPVDPLFDLTRVLCIIVSTRRFLQLTFTADMLDVGGRCLHHDFVRYFGLGRSVICMYQVHRLWCRSCQKPLPLQPKSSAPVLSIRTQGPKQCTDYKVEWFYKCPVRRLEY